jgi:hypothetical protein
MIAYAAAVVSRFSDINGSALDGFAPLLSV